MTEVPETESPLERLAFFDSTPAAKIAEVRAGAEEATVTEAVNVAQSVREEQAKQANALRARFYKMMEIVSVGAISVAVIGMAMYMWAQWGELEPSVMVAFFASVVAQTLGLAFIVARYLFPNSNKE